MLARVPQSLIDRAAAYRDGINAYIDYVSGAGVAELPGEFAALGALPIDHWTLRDTARVGIFLARTVPSGDGNELANALALGDVGRKGFDLLHPVRTKGRLTTVPRAEGTFPAQPGRTRRDERRGYAKTLAYLRQHRPLLGRRHDRRAADAARPARAPTSRACSPTAARSCGRSATASNGHAYLYNGPQLGFSSPELFVEFELHSPSQPNLRGVSAAGIPLIGIGHNDRVAWGFTSGLSDEDDLYVEKVTGPETYEFRGEEMRMDCRDETFTFNTPVTDLPDLIDEARRRPSGQTTSASAARSTGRSRRPATASRSPAATRSGGASWRRSSASRSSTTPRASTRSTRRCAR